MIYEGIKKRSKDFIKLHTSKIHLSVLRFHVTGVIHWLLQFHYMESLYYPMNIVHSSVLK